MNKSPQEALNILAEVLEKDQEEFEIGGVRYVRNEAPTLNLLLKKILVKLDSIDKNLRMINDIDFEDQL